MLRLILTIALVVTLSGCSFSGLFAGNYTETPITDPVTGELARTWYGGIAKTRTRQSKTVGVANAGANMVAAAAMQPKSDTNASVSCSLYSDVIVERMTPDQLSRYFNWQANCIDKRMANRPMEIMGHALAAATGGNVTDMQAIAKSAFAATTAVERESTAKVRAIANPLAVTIGVRSVQKTQQVSAEAIRDVGIAAARNGGITTVGNIAISSSQSASADSNDGLGEGGAGTGSATASRSDTAPIILNIGDGNNTGIATDNARALVDTNATQVAEPSSTQNQSVDSRQNGVVTADEQNGAPSNEDNDGGQTLF